MKIDFKKLIKESGEQGLNQTILANEMTEEGLFKNLHSAINMIQYHQNGSARSCDYALLKWLCQRFKRQGSEIIQWDEL